MFDSQLKLLILAYLDYKIINKISKYKIDNNIWKFENCNTIIHKPS